MESGQGEAGRGSGITARNKPGDYSAGHEERSPLHPGVRHVEREKLLKAL